MFIYISLNQIKNYHNTYRQQNKKPIIIIPKRNVKFANKRNKIRRQIKEILKQYRCCNQRNVDNFNVNNYKTNNSILIVKYLDKKITPSFKDLQKNILTKIVTIK